MSRPALALVSMMLVAATALAFYLGKRTAMAAQNSEPAANATSQIPGSGEKLLYASGSNVLTGDHAVTEPKIVAAPVVQERTITRTIYITRKPGAAHGKQMSETSPGKKRLKPDEKVPGNPYYTALDLKGFQPVAEMKIKITKKEY